MLIVPAHCERPSIILNPCFSELVSKYRNYTLRGVEHLISKSYKVIYYALKVSSFQPKNLDISYSDICSCYVTDYVSGERYPMYLQVPCGHCDICKHNKMMSFVERCKLETQLYNCKPIFITLTYDEHHKKDFGVCLRDIQLFFKRLRINLYRKGYREKIRYALVAEYGHNTHRPHYHAILWNLQANDILSYREVRDIVEKSWSNGFIQFRFIDPNDDKAFFYTAKYLRKDCHVPAGCRETFMVSSNRGGSIGSAYYYRLREHVCQTLNTKLKYVNKWSHKVADVRLDRYSLNKIVPSLSHSLPYSIKKRVRRFVVNYEKLYLDCDINSLPFKDTYSLIRSVFPKYFYVPTDIPYIHSIEPEKPYHTLLREMLDDEPKILKVLHMDNLDDLYRLSCFRSVFVDKLMSVVTPVNLERLAYKYRVQRQKSHIYDVL